MRIVHFGFSLLLAPAIAAAQQYVISTYVGGSPPPTPVPGLQAAIGSPVGLATDTAGNVYFTSIQCLFKLDANGTLTRLAGSSRAAYSGDGGPASSAELSLQAEGKYPGGWGRTEAESSTWGGVAVDKAGNIYIADSGNYRVRKVSPDGFITTAAGNGTAGYSGDGGPATAAQLDTAAAVAVDNQGNLYIAEDRNHRIRKVSPAGIITTVAGNGASGYSGDGGPATSAQIGVPLSVAVDSAGNLYIATAEFDISITDSDIQSIRQVSSSGVITTVARRSWPGPMANFNAHAVAVDGASNLYIAESWRVSKLLPDPSTNVMVGFASALAVDNAGNLYIASDQRIRKVTDGVITTVAGDGVSRDTGLETGHWNDIAADSRGNVYIAVRGLLVHIVSPDGTIVAVGGAGNATYGVNPYDPSTIAVDQSGNMYVASRNRVYKITAAGSITEFAGAAGDPGYSGDGGPATRARLFSVRGLAADSDGNLYIADYSRVRKVSPNGIITTVAGGGNTYPGDGGRATDAQLKTAWALAINAGSLYIADIEYGLLAGKFRVRKVSPDGIITTVAGDGSFGFSGDGGPAANARLDGPSGLAFDKAGNLFIADTYNHRIRMISPDGIITTVAGTGSAGYSGDGGPATRARFGYVSGLAIDSSGNLYARDLTHNVVRLLQPISPSLVITGVTNAASNRTGPIAPGEIVVIGGVRTGLDERTTLRFNGTPASWIAWPGMQVAAIVPYALFGDVAHVTIAAEGQISAPLSVPIAPAAPGIFTQDQTGAGQAAAVNQDGSVNAATRPARVGEIISLYATGEGQTLPPGEDGKPILPVRVTIGGRTVTPTFAGASGAATAGVMQVNVEIPSGIQAGSAVPVSVQVGNAASQPGVTIAVQ